MNQLPDEKKPSFFELVYYPVKGASLYNHQMLIGQKNRWYAQHHRALTNTLADRVKLYHDSLAIITNHYNHLLNGKWKGMMTAPGFLSEPQLSPAQKIEVPEISEMAIFVEGQEPDSMQSLTLPNFYSYSDESHYFELYNKGTLPFRWNAQTARPWIILDATEVETKIQNHVHVSINWENVPEGDSAKGLIVVAQGNKTENIQVKAFHP